MSWISTIDSTSPSRISESLSNTSGDLTVADSLYPELVDCNDQTSITQLIDEALADIATKQSLLGQTLLRAGLINRHQIEVALADARFSTDLRIGEIFASHGWIAQETADFFAERLPRLSEERPKLPIGQYLKSARLVTQEQIDKILDIQRHYPVKFGEIAVTKHYIKQQTLGFILGYLR